MQNEQFNLNNTSAWLNWAEQKQKNTVQHIDDLIIEVRDLNCPSSSEIKAIKAYCKQYNMAIFTTSSQQFINPKSLRIFSSYFGLHHLQHNEGADSLGISHIKENKEDWHTTYIPYTTKAINWHTDGYYNSTNEQINGMVLYCDTPAVEGGENALLDPELAYLYLREKGNEYIQALMHPNTMMIPFNDVEDHVQRENSEGPVFSFNVNGQLHMRYTARKHNIVWRDDETTTQAVCLLKELMDSSHPWILKGTLQSGQGLICNNVLHNRSAFINTNQQQRLLYRCRYLDCIS